MGIYIYSSKDSGAAAKRISKLKWILIVHDLRNFEVYRNGAKGWYVYVRRTLELLIFKKNSAVIALRAPSPASQKPFT